MYSQELERKLRGEKKEEKRIDLFFVHLTPPELEKINDDFFIKFNESFWPIKIKNSLACTKFRTHLITLAYNSECIKHHNGSDDDKATTQADATKTRYRK